MGLPIPSDERTRLTDLYIESGGTALCNALMRLADKGFDVAGFPFRLIDYMLCHPGTPVWGDIDRLTQLLLGGQPRLFIAVLMQIDENDPEPLAALASDPQAHPKTRWGATTWQVFFRHRATTLPDDGPPTPRILQFWDKGKPPADVTEAMETWASLGTDHKKFSEAHATRFITRIAGQDAADRFTALWHPALKSDLFRLYALFDRGGLYVDADSLPQDGIEQFLAHGGGDVWASSVTDRPHCAAINGFLAAPPKSPLIGDFLDHVLANIDAAQFRNIYWLAGPGTLTRFLQTTGHEIRLLPSGLLKSQLFKQIDAGYKTSPRNWRVFEKSEGLSDDDILSTLFTQAT